MTRDWHATFLTDARAMAAARDRANRCGDDGWAAAYTVALTLPPASGSHAATGARDVLVPDTLPDAGELARLEVAAPDGDAGGGYYGEPNIGRDNPDMSASLLRRARYSDKKVRPDLKCPSCCAVDGEPEQAGVQGQAYRCTTCGKLWNYVPSEHGEGCGQCLWCLMRSQLDAAAADEQAVRIFDYLRNVTVSISGPDGVVTMPLLPVVNRRPPVEPSWPWSGTSTPVSVSAPEWERWQPPDQSPPPPFTWSRSESLPGVTWVVDESAELFDPARVFDPQWADGARMIADAFDLPEHVVRGETDEEYQRRVETEADELLALLHMVSRGRVTATEVDAYPATPEARRRRLLVVGGAERGHARRHERRVHLTALGRITYRALRGRSRRRNGAG